MAVYHRIYLFDVGGYKREMEPVVANLVLGQTDTLRVTANKIALKKPSVWNLLKDHRFYPSDLGREEWEFDLIESRVRFWMFLILAAFWSPLTIPRDYATTVTQVLNPAFPEVAKKLVKGRPFFELFFSGQTADSNIPFWCQLGSVGWLDCDDVINLEAILIRQQRLYTQPDLRKVYRLVIRLLSTARRRRKGLFLAIVD